MSNNKELAFELIYETPGDRKWLKDISPKIRNNKEYMLEAVKQNGKALEFVTEKLRNDKDVTRVYSLYEKKR